MILSTATNLLFERVDGTHVPIGQSIRACAEAGFEALDFGFVELALVSSRFAADDWRDELREYAALAEGLGIRFVQAHATLIDFCTPGADYDRQLELFHRSIDGAALLGAHWLVAHPVSGPLWGEAGDDTPARNAAFFRSAADYAAERGVGIALENMWGRTPYGRRRYAATAQELAALIADIGRDNVGACWDVGHAGLEAIDQNDSIRLLGRRLVATHISDEAGVAHIHRLPYTGCIAWDAVLSALAAVEYDGAFSFEMQHYLPRMPMPLVPDAMRLAVRVGRHMVARLQLYQKEAQRGTAG